MHTRPRQPTVRAGGPCSGILSVCVAAQDSRSWPAPPSGKQHLAPGCRLVPAASSCCLEATGMEREAWMCRRGHARAAQMRGASAVGLTGILRHISAGGGREDLRRNSGAALWGPSLFRSLFTVFCVPDVEVSGFRGDRCTSCQAGKPALVRQPQGAGFEACRGRLG